MIRFPRGNVTFLCARLDSSTSERGAELMRAAIAVQEGVLFHDDGTMLYAAFSGTLPALDAALETQRQILAAVVDTADSPGPAMAIHTGPAHERNGVYFGPTLNRVLSMLAAAHFGQILISSTINDLLQKSFLAKVHTQDLGEYRLKDLFRTAQLYQVVAPDLPSQFPPLQTLDGRPHNLPIQDSPLIGREQEVSAVNALFRQPTPRLVTLLGSSGMGKTRLALQIAVEVIDDFPDGVWFVALAPITDPGLLISSIAQVLGVREQPGQALLTTLTSFLQTKQMLLVLDNFEQIWAAAPMINELLAATQSIKVLVTSQVMLELEHEHVFGVPPLAMPDPAERLSLAALSQIPAVALFVERAREVHPSFLLTEGIAPAVIELCTWLEGVPLAIGLVAAQSKRYFPSDMLVMLQSRLNVARTIRRGNTREDTLRPVLDWICEGLGASVAGFFARLGVFAGGCTSESAKTICNPTNDLALDVEETLMVLLANHLLLREELKEGHVRYTMLDAIHDYAQQRLTKRREATRLYSAHANYYTTLAETAEPLLRGAEQELWLGRLEDEHHNLRAALTWTLAHDAGLALRQSGALALFWFMHGHFREGRQWLQTALDQAQNEPTGLRAKALNNLGVLAYAQGEYDVAIAAYEAALALRRKLGDTAGTSGLLNNLGIIAWQRGDYARASALFEECLPLGRELGNEWGVADTLNNLGGLMYDQADLARAEYYYQECLTLRTQLGDNWGRSSVLTNLGLVAYDCGNYDRADALLGQALDLARELGDESQQASIFEIQAQVWLARAEVGPARRALTECIRIRQQQGQKSTLGSILEVFAELLVAEDQAQQAAMCLGCSAALRSELGIPASIVQQRQIDMTRTNAMAQLGEEAFATAWQIGTSTPVDDLLSQVLSIAV